MDLDRLGTGERIAGVSAIVLFVFMFVDWYDVSVSGGGFSTGTLGSGSAWDALDNLPIFLVVVVVAVLALVVFRLSDSVYELPFPASVFVAGLGLVSALLILYRIIDTPYGGDYGGVSVDVSPTLGIFVSLIAAGGIAYGGWKAMQEEGVSIG